MSGATRIAGRVMAPRRADLLDHAEQRYRRWKIASPGTLQAALLDGSGYRFTCCVDERRQHGAWRPAEPAVRRR